MKAREGNIQSSKGAGIAYWIFTGLFALQMGFTAYAHLALPQAAQVFGRLGFPDYFRIELSVAKLVGLVVLLVPMVPGVIKEWAYAGFAIVLGSAVIAHLAIGEGAAAWGWAVGTFVLEALSYYFYRRRGRVGEAVSVVELTPQAAA
jgi:DoxX-like family